MQPVFSVSRVAECIKIANGMLTMKEERVKAIASLRLSTEPRGKQRHQSFVEVLHTKRWPTKGDLATDSTGLFAYGDSDIRPSWPVEQVANLMPRAGFELIKGAEHVIWFSHESELKSLLRVLSRTLEELRVKEFLTRDHPKMKRQPGRR